MKFKCMYCGIHFEGKWPEPNAAVEDGDFEQKLWGHIQMNHPDIFEDYQNLETPDMLEMCYERIDDKPKVYVVLEVYDQNDFVDHYGEFAMERREIKGIYNSRTVAEYKKKACEANDSEMIEKLDCNPAWYEIEEWPLI